MTSVLLNGGILWLIKKWILIVALDDVSVTEWRAEKAERTAEAQTVALDDVSVTEWRPWDIVKKEDLSDVALDDVSVTEWRKWENGVRKPCGALHSMTSVLLNGGWVLKGIEDGVIVALDDVSVTEWRLIRNRSSKVMHTVALDDVSVTEWRLIGVLISPDAIKLHSMTSVLLNGGRYRMAWMKRRWNVALDDVSVTEWREAVHHQPASRLAGCTR